MRLDLPLQGLDLGVEHVQDGEQYANGGGVGGGYGLRLTKVPSAQRRLDRCCLRGHVSAAGALQSGADLG
ncbi:hypothetical protein ACIQU6_42020 [Streptomyces sp. NPDC090442]|uniref:hypothetical protein n=1 Tax=Streptomyces sp. NPDC090442 TaxID=3365962 RepID=UPI00381EE5F9